MVGLSNDIAHSPKLGPTSDGTKTREHKWDKRSLVIRGKAKSVCTTDEYDKCKMLFSDNITSGDGEKQAEMAEKGRINCGISAKLMTELNRINIPTHFIEQTSPVTQYVHRLDMIPLEFVCRNVVAGSMAERLGLEEGASIAKLSNNVFPCLIDVHLKNDELHDPLISQDIAQALNIVSEKDLNLIVSLTHSINYFLKDYMKPKNTEVIDFKLEFGHDVENKIRLGDEITPDSCRFWEIGTGRKMDKDRFRRNLGLVEETYKELEYTIVGQENS